MALDIPSGLNPRSRYLQIALNNTLSEAQQIIMRLPMDSRIILEVGTPLIKEYGAQAIRNIRSWYSLRAAGAHVQTSVAQKSLIGMLINAAMQGAATQLPANAPVVAGFQPYIVADMKTMDRGQREVAIAANAGANAVIALGTAPTETLNAFIAACRSHGVDPMIDMMNVEYPINVLGKLKKLPPIVILHRGVDEEDNNREKQLPLHHIQRIKGAYNMMVSVAGGDKIREVQRAFFNDADIVVAWRSFYSSTDDTASLAQRFLQEVK